MWEIWNFKENRKCADGKLLGEKEKTQTVGLAVFSTANSLLVSAANELWGAAAGLSRTSGAVAEDRKEGWGGGRGGGWKQPDSTGLAHPTNPPQCPVLALSPSATAFSRHLHYSKINALSILCLHTLDMCAAPFLVLPRVSHPCCPQDMLQMKSNGYC